MDRNFVPTYVTMRPHNQLGHWQPLQVLSLDGMLSTVFRDTILDYITDGSKGSSSSPCRGIQSLFGSCPPSRMVRRPWVQTLDVIGYTPDEVKVTTEDEKVIVHARHEYKDGENYQTSETRRTVRMPEGVNKDKLVCYFSRDGRLVIKAPYVACNEDGLCCTNTKPFEVDSCTKSKDLKSAVGGTDTTTAKLDSNSAPEVDDTDKESAFGDQNDKIESVDLEVIGKEDAIMPLMDSVDIVNVDDKKCFEVKVNLTCFKPEHVSIRCKDNMICIDAKQETTHDGMRMLQEVHRQYLLPREGRIDLAKATLGDNGLVTVSVPMEDKQTSEDQDHVEIPIVYTL